MALKKALIEWALGAELSHHLGYPPGAAKPQESPNQRNGKSGKTVLTHDGPLQIDVPRDREGSFEPILIPKHKRRFTGFDDKIVAIYARGMTVREIQGFLTERYGVDAYFSDRALHHKVFDLGAFTILPDTYSLVFSQHVVAGEASRHMLMGFHGAGLIMPQSKEYYPKPEFLHWHAKEVFKQPGREL